MIYVELLPPTGMGAMRYVSVREIASWQILIPFMAAFGAALIVFIFYNPKHTVFCVVGLLAMICPHPRIVSLLAKFNPKRPLR